jgi:chitinase
MVILVALSFLSAAPSSVSASKRLLGYYGYWMKWETPRYDASAIPFSQLTHISHCNISPAAAANGSLDIPAGFEEPALITNAHKAGVKVLICLQGEATTYAKLAANPTARVTFARALHDLVTTKGYDGVDNDWEVPQGPQEEANYTQLMSDLRAQLPSPYLLSAAIPSSPGVWGDFDLPALMPLVDFINVMTYDFHGSWSSHAGHNSPLLQSAADPDLDGSCVSTMDNFLINFNVPPEKINMGTAFYIWKFGTVSNLWGACNCNSSNTHQMYYREIKPLINHGWIPQFDPLAQAPYLLTADHSPGFISYDDPSSTKAKVDYALHEKNLGGVFMWLLGGDYDGETQELMTAMYNAFIRATQSHDRAIWKRPVEDIHSRER